LQFRKLWRFYLKVLLESLEDVLRMVAV
jgi:hypothetical protein